MKINKKEVKKEVKNKLQKLFNEKFCEDFEKYYENEEKDIAMEGKKEQSRKYSESKSLESISERRLK